MDCSIFEMALTPVVRIMAASATATIHHVSVDLAVTF